MKLNTRAVKDVVIFDLKGKLMGGPEDNIFPDTLKAEIAKGFKRFIFDLGEVEWMNSSGLGILISALTTIKNAGGELKLARVTDKIQNLFVITKLVTIFESTESVEEALRSF